MSSLQTFIRPNCQYDYCYSADSQGRSHDFSLMGRAPRRDNQGAEVVRRGGWVSVPLPTGGEVWGGLCPLPKKFLHFYIKIVSFRTFWVVISYRLVDCFSGIGNTPGIEIYWRSFQHFGN